MKKRKRKGRKERRGERERETIREENPELQKTFEVG